jgi:hypothetical protein
MSTVIPKPQGVFPEEKNSGLGIQTPIQTTMEASAKESAKDYYAQKILQTNQQHLKQRQTIEQDAAQAQQQLAGQQYALNQSIEKAGWTGGYVSDVLRQKEFLQNSIAAGMYGAMELQKANINAGLAEARFYYDTKKEELALQAYETAVQSSLYEAEQTGIFMSPETKDMLAQRSMADKVISDLEALGDGFETNQEYIHAKAVKDNINKWFVDNNISEAGVKTLTRINTEILADQHREAMTQVALETKSPSQWAYVDPTTNKPMTDANGNVTFIDLGLATKDQVKTFIETSGNAANAVSQELNVLASSTVDGFLRVTDITNMRPEKIQELFEEYLDKNNTNLVKDFITNNELDYDWLKQATPSMFSGNLLTVEVKRDGKTYSISPNGTARKETTPEAKAKTEFMQKYPAATFVEKNGKTYALLDAQTSTAFRDDMNRNFMVTFQNGTKYELELGAKVENYGKFIGVFNTKGSDKFKKTKQDWVNDSSWIEGEIRKVDGDTFGKGGTHMVIRTGNDFRLVEQAGSNKEDYNGLMTVISGTKYSSGFKFK